MLIEIAVTDFAIIASTRLEFGPGMHVLTGETGAGKSILLDALGLVLGDRASADVVRTGARRARIEALFDLADAPQDRIAAMLHEQGIDSEGDQLVITREIQAGGRSIARINGQIVTVGLLSEIGGMLVDVHGQSDHFTIRRKDEQRRILDRYAGLEPLAAEVRAQVDAVTEVRNRLESLTTGERERAQRRDLLAYQVEEIEEAALQPGEDEALAQEQRVLGNAEMLREEALRTLALLAGSDVADEGVDVSSALRLAEQGIHRIVDVDASSAPLAERVSELAILAEDLSRDLRGYLDTIEVNEERLTEIEDRLELIRSLKRKYGSTIDDVIAYGDEARRELESLSGEDFDTDALQARLVALEDRLASLVVNLSTKRRQAAERLSVEIEESISSLRMGNGVVRIEVRQVDDPRGLNVTLDGEARTVHFDRTGIDDVEILVAPNRGEAPKPLGRIASGGETARIMLAFKSVLSEHDATPTLVFDEIDVGVGGRTGQVVGERLRDLAERHQVIVITHLPQIAAMAHRHAKISKAEMDNRVVSVVADLHDGEVEHEIAAMLDGEPVTPASIDTAREMIARSLRYRPRSRAS
ncbi:MAG TPA: DNA repair protein RecN [Thermomicrobiales bacterium]|nr:DNA repair protein RecN [Thermomicrobiales bacterium]